MIIFSPGPANISERVRKALIGPDICHRDIEFENILANTRKLILQTAKVSNGYESVIFGGSGTLAIESVISSFNGYDKRILIISNGIYGERAANISRIHNINIEEIKLEWGMLPDVSQIENKLKSNDFGAVYIVHHETTTGLLNPLQHICDIAKKYKKLVLTDAVGSFAGEGLDISDWGIDVAICSANKCIRSVPGISFVVVSKRFIDTVERYKSSSFYADLMLHLRSELNGQMPFTPALQVFYALEEALKELLEEGIETRINNYKNISNFLRQGLKDIGIKFFLSEALMSNTMTAVYTPKGLSYSTLHDHFKKKGFVIYTSQGRLRDNTFRLGTVGVISQKDIAEFLNAFKEIS